MQEPTDKQWWHVYGGVMDEADIYQSVVAGPTPVGPDGTLGSGRRVRDELSPGVPYLTSFDHKPTEFEKDQLQPERFREYHADGSLIEPLVVLESENTQTGVKMTTHHPFKQISDEEY